MSVTKFRSYLFGRDTSREHAVQLVERCISMEVLVVEFELEDGVTGALRRNARVVVAGSTAINPFLQYSVRDEGNG